MLLNCHTYYSYKFGTLTIEELLENAQKAGHDCVALTDINSTSAVINFLRLAPQYGITPVIGIDFRNGADQKYVGLARTNEGYRELNEHLNAHSHDNIPFANHAPAFQHAYVIYKRGTVAPSQLRENEYLGVSVREVNQLAFADRKAEQAKWVYFQPVTFLSHNEKGKPTKKYFNAHRLLRAIDNNTLLSMLSKSEEGKPDDTIRTPGELQRVFEGYPSVLINTARILADCRVDFDFGIRSRNKKTLHGVAEDIAIMREECRKGLEYRYGKHPPSNVLERLDTELNVIIQLDFCAYFLINWEMVNYARNKGYFYIGRGSGANSLVAYLMRITDVDPIELDLYFERFINPYRKSPPDFDIDFSWTDREDVTKYLFETYSHTHTALVGAYNTFQFKSVIRELGKVFGLPAHEIDLLQEAKNHTSLDSYNQTILRYAGLIQDFPSHLSIHSSGIIISDEPISTYTATMLPPKGFPTTHFSMLESEDIGLHKYDVLGQRGLAKIKDAVQLIRENRGVTVDIHDIPKFKNDQAVQQLLRQGKAIGCFYVESPAMRMLLTKLKAHDYIRLVAASSIIRPGVAKSGMMREYILRFQDEERRKQARDALPELYDLLAETYGVMVYQEDVLKVAHIFGGLTLAEADILRRGMNWKYMQREEFRSVRGKFFENCMQKGHKPEVVQAIWTQIESFANFAFAKGHSASYAVESFQALYLKAHYPLEYMVATTNNGGGFYNVELYIHELRMHGAEVEAPCINTSEATNTITGITVILGLGGIAQLEQQVVETLLEDRAANGKYTSLRNFIERVPVSLEQL
ncbi:MAG: DNA polymerase III subunit alpha, partial [Bacteroidota bacterium]